MSDNPLFVPWTQYMMLVEQLCSWLREHNYCFRHHALEGVYGVPRGGSVLAVCVSHQTGLKFYPTFPISTRVLVVDDIVDTGYTMGGFIVQNFATASLYCREGCMVKPWLSVQDVAPGIWVRFPYETEESTLKVYG